MADMIDLRVCVLAPLFDELGQLPDDLQNLLGQCAAVYDTATRNKVYGNARDVWKPFDGEKSITDYIREAGFRPNSLSGQLQVSMAPASLQTLLRDVDLYVIDPVFLGLAALGETVRRIEAAISGDKTDSKRFALLIPKHLPSDLQAKMEEFARGLELLENAYQQSGDDLWLGETSLRFKAFLRQMFKRMKNRPLPSRVEDLDRLAAAFLGAQLSFGRPTLLGGS